MKPKTKNKEVEKAVKIVKGQQKLAELVGVKQPSVWRWVHGISKPEAEKVLLIVKATQGKCKAHLIRPDLPTLFPNPNSNLNN